MEEAEEEETQDWGGGKGLGVGVRCALIKVVDLQNLVGAIRSTQPTNGSELDFGLTNQKKSDPMRAMLLLP